MKHRVICLAIFLSMTFAFDNHAQQDEFPVLSGPYLSQKPPGMTPEILAPGIVSSEEFVDFKLAFSPAERSAISTDCRIRPMNSSQPYFSPRS